MDFFVTFGLSKTFVLSDFANVKKKKIHTT